MPLPRRIRDRLRPAVHAARRMFYRVEAAVRPMQRWNGVHHPVPLRFAPWRGVSDGRFQHDFLGVRTDPKFRSEFRADPRGPVQPDYPPPLPSYFELVFVLQAVLDAGESFTMIEAGAGYGFWLVTAARALDRLGKKAPRLLVGVEMDPIHHGWMIEHFRNNGLDPEAHRLIRAAVTDRTGQVQIASEPDPDRRYGQHLSRQATEAGSRRPEDLVSLVTMEELLEPCGVVDLVHMDVQGEELRALEPARALLDRRVRRILVATHSRRNHLGVRRILSGLGWSCRADYGMGSRQRTDFGDVRFIDGILAFENPRKPDTGTNEPR
jgi:FkbM family methyltransferase